MIIDEGKLLEDTIATLMGTYEYSREEAEKWCDIHLDECTDDMFDAQSNYISNHVVGDIQSTTDSCPDMKVVFGVDRDS